MSKRENYELLCIAGGNVPCAAAVENGMTVPQEFNTELPCDPAIPLLGIHPEEWKAKIQAYMCTSMTTAALFTTAAQRKQPRRPWMGEWIIHHSNIARTYIVGMVTHSGDIPHVTELCTSTWLIW